LARIRLVVADDNAEFLEELVRFLGNHFEVLAAVADGEELINSAILVNPDVIVSDVCMPVFTGPEAMQELHTRGIKIPFVLISADENASGKHTSFVFKDKIPNQLVEAIHKVISG
jgi:CheY-like chemotaxis protein